MGAQSATLFSEIWLALGLADEIEELRTSILAWIEISSPELKAALRWQLVTRSKYFRPLTIFACRRAVNSDPVPEIVMRSAVALELIHNVSLIIDDILDRSRLRRSRLTLHCRFGNLVALMTAGYLTAGAFALVESDPYSIRVLGELLQRLGIAECLQWRLRRRPLGIEDWRAIAAEDTGSMFELCAALGTRDDRLRKFGQLLGMLYHGCDDVGDVRGAAALGGSGAEDLRDGILTLPAAIAIRDPGTALLFQSEGNGDRAQLIERMTDCLEEAENYLDTIASEAAREARSKTATPTQLLALVRYTRTLSRR